MGQKTGEDSGENFEKAKLKQKHMGGVVGRGECKDIEVKRIFVIYLLF